jgi:phosphoribosylformylglycinamidine cyclo-ligase
VTRYTGSFRTQMVTAKSISYKQSGVDIDEADRAVASISKMARATFTKGVLTEIGSFGACFELPKMRKPVLISSVDGVGTKLKIAFMTGRHGTIGEDLVNHCVNDIAVQGAVPLFFMDYLAVGKLDAHVASQIVSGITRGCKANGCALIGGETAEMPGLYNDGEYDLAGTIVGAAEKAKIITGSKLCAGDILLGLPSTGLHTNGYSLARKTFFEVGGYTVDSMIPELGRTLGEELLSTHRSYLRPIQALAKAGLLLGAAHITGGGISDNTPRILPKGLAASIDTSAWTVPPIFEILRSIGNVQVDDYRRTLNLGVGMILAVSQKKVDAATRILAKLHEKPFIVGEVVKHKRGRERVEYR